MYRYLFYFFLQT